MFTKGTTGLARFFATDIDTHDLDELLAQVSGVVNTKRSTLASKARTLTNDSFESDYDRALYEDMLSDEDCRAGELQELAEALVIVGLYRQIESKVSSMLRYCFPSYNDKQRGQFLRGDHVIHATHTIAFKTLSGFDALNELRLINNCVKHADSRVSKQLNKAYPHWKLGEKMTGLGDFYRANKKAIEGYVGALAKKSFDFRDNEMALTAAANAPQSQATSGAPVTA